MIFVTCGLCYLFHTFSPARPFLYRNSAYSYFHCFPMAMARFLVVILLKLFLLNQLGTHFGHKKGNDKEHSSYLDWHLSCNWTLRALEASFILSSAYPLGMREISFFPLSYFTIGLLLFLYIVDIITFIPDSAPS